MKSDEYLKAILRDQTLTDDSAELKTLQKERENVEKIIKASFSGTAITVRYGGSKAKGTIIKDNYDLDIVAYVAYDDDGAGKTLKELYNNFADALEKQYFLKKKRSAIRLQSKEKVNLHIDVVPGRFVDDKKEDTYLFQNGPEADKERLKTNLQTHIDHVKNSGYVDEIRLLKLWKTRIELDLKTFILELLVIKVLSDAKAREGLSGNLKLFWNKMKDEAETILVKDPANPQGNDLSSIFDNEIRKELSIASKNALKQCSNDDDWKKIFGEIVKSDLTEKAAMILCYAASTPSAAQPWCQYLK